MGGDRQRNRQTPIHGQYLNGRWPTRRKLMGRACCCAPALGPPAPMASHTWCCTLLLLEPSARTVWAMCTRVCPWPPHPRSLCHRRQLRLLGFSALHAPSLWFLSYPKPSCTAPERLPILQNLSRERRKQACAAASSLHPPTAYGPPHCYPPTLAYHHSTLSLAAPWPCSLLFCLLFFFFQTTPSQPPNLWTGWQRDRPHSPNTACLARTTPNTTTTLLYASPGLRAEVYRPITTAHSDRRCWALGRRGDKERWKGITEARVAEAWCRASCCW